MRATSVPSGRCASSWTRTRPRRSRSRPPSRRRSSPPPRRRGPARAAAPPDGVYPYLVTTGAVARTREAIGPDKLVVASLPVALGVGARERARTYVGVYREVRTYRENLGALGFGDEDFDPEPSDRLVDALVASGDAAAIRARIAELDEAGADQVVLMTLDGDPWYEPSLATLRALAPA